VAVTENVQEVGHLKWFYREALPVNPTEKPAVVLLHGLVSQSYGWRNTLPELADQGFRAIAPDWIGGGFSSKPDRREFAYTPDAFVEAFATFVQDLQLDRLSLIVQGYLGTVGLQYALRHPEQIERLIILNAPITPNARVPWKIKQFAVPFLGDVITQDPLLVDRTLEGGGGYRVEDADLDVYRRPFLKSSDAGRALLATVQNLNLPQVTTEIQTGFAEWQQPILVAWGIRDPWLPVAIAESFVQSVPQAELSKLEEVGHYPQEDWHEKLNAVLLTFLRKQIV
jgi:pimeloyl-ACP methyl ester carboxylesterase